MPYLNFLVFVAILVYFAKNPLRELARKRNDSFESFRAKALAAKKEAESRLEDVQRRLENLDAEIENLKKNAIAEAKKEASVIIGKGRLIAQQMLEDAKRSGDAEVLFLRQRLKEEIAKTAKEVLVSRLQSEFTEKQDEIFSSLKIAELSEWEEVRGT
ncbi:MAG: hypothetical protein HYW48_12500 [Deltaproteobacteria bacterium]|nr:hypothetical protein [Deltaproteobacteria bacterium]